MKKILYLIISIVSIGLVASAALPVYAVEVFDQCSDTNIPVDSTICDSVNEESGDLPNMLGVIINTLLILIGMVSVVMIVIGGFRYTLSRGEASEIKTAKDIILYAIIGLIVAVMAYAIVNFVLDWF
jgi:hypothetical protein